MSYKEIAESATRLVEDYQKKTVGIPYEAKGVLSSEMLFMISCLSGKPLGRILESGRARGQSTLLLARALPETEIISIEFDPDSEDVSIANERLAGEENVTLLFGDARRELPRLVQEGDAVIIDGPKMFRAIRLALSLLATKKVTHVFLHDVSKSTPERKFLDMFMPECRFSDQYDIATVTHKVDVPNDHIPPEQRLGGFEGQFGYGYSLGCIPYVRNRSYGVLMIMAIIYDILARMARKFSR